jgi:hypothetical protein
MNSQDQDYYIETVDTGVRPHPWRRELKQRSSPMGIKLGAGGYQSEAAAQYAGQRALAEFLKDLAREDRRLRCRDDAHERWRGLPGVL